MSELAIGVVAEPLWHRVPGGTGRATLALIEGLARHEDVDLSLASAKHLRNKDHQLPSTPSQWVLPRVGLYESWARFGGRPGTSRVAPAAQLIHSPMLPAPRRGRRPLVVTLHDLAFIQEPGMFPRRPRRLYERMWRAVRSEADIVVCSSIATRDIAVEYGLDASRARVVPLGASVQNVAEPDVERVRSHYGLADPYVLFVGTAEPRKNLGRLLRAYGQSGLGAHGTELAVVGPAGWQEDVGALVNDLPAGVRPRVRVFGEVPETHLHALYSGAKLFCYPSIVEGFGLPVLEAMAHGTPVLTSRDSAPAEIVGDSGVLVDPSDVDDLASALAGIVADPERADRFGRAGPAIAAQFTWERHIEATVGIYHELLS